MVVILALGVCRSITSAKVRNTFGKSKRSPDFNFSLTFGDNKKPTTTKVIVVIGKTLNPLIHQSPKSMLYQQ